MSVQIKSIVRGSVWLFIANIVTKTINVVLALVLIRGLGVNDYGFLMTVWGGATLFAGGLDLGMSQALLREGARDNRLIGSFVKHIIAIRLPLTLVMLFAIVAFEGEIIKYDYPEVYFSAILLLILVALIPLVDSWHFPFAFICYIFNQFRIVAIYRSLYFALILFMVVLSVYLFHSIEIVAIAYSVVTLVAIILFYKSVAPLIPKHSKSNLSFKNAIKQGMPFLAINILTLAYMRIELLLLSAMLSTFESGVYSVQYQIILLFYMVPGLVYNALMPSLYKYSKNFSLLRDAFSKICRYLNLYALMLTPMVIYLADELMMIIGGEELRGQSSGLRFLALMLIFLFSTASLNFLNVLDMLNKRIIYEATGLIFLIISGVLIIPVYEVNGIAIVAVISYGIIGTLSLFKLYFFGVVDYKQILKDLLIMLPCVGIASVIFFYGTSMIWLNVIIYFILVLVLLSIFRFWTTTDYRIFTNIVAFITMPLS